MVKSVPNSQKGNLKVRAAATSSEDEVIRIREEILKQEGKINHVVSSLGGWWQKGTLSHQSLDEYRKIIDDSATSHFIVYKTFSKILSETPNSTYTFITGTIGEKGLPDTSLITIGSSVVYGIYQAARGEHKKSPNLAVNEVRYGLLIKNIPDKDVDPAESAMTVGNEWAAKFVTKAISKHQHTYYRIVSRQQGDELYASL